MAVLNAFFITLFLLLSISAAHGGLSSLLRARCASDANTKTPLTGMLAQKQGDWMPQLAGWTVRVPWSAIEPTQGNYYFDTIDRAITYASNTDGYRFQGVIIEITAGDEIPQWLKIDNTMVPFWVGAYQTAYRALMSQLATRYDGNPVVRGISLSACVRDSLSNVDAMRHGGWTELADVQCYYDAMFSHLAAWPNTPTVLTLDARSSPAAEDFRALFGPRMGSVLINQGLNVGLASDLFARAKHLAQGSLIVSFTGNLRSGATYESYFAAAHSASATAIALPIAWNTPGPYLVEQTLIDQTRDKLAVAPEQCEQAPGRAVTKSVATVPSFSVTISLEHAGATPTRGQVLDSLVRLTGLSASRFTVAPLQQSGQKLRAVAYIYDSPYGAPSALVAHFLVGVSEAQWRQAGLQAKSAGIEAYEHDDETDGLTIFLIVLAAVIYVCVFGIFCYLLFTIARFCLRDQNENNASMRKFGGLGRRMKGWVLFNDETPAPKCMDDERGFPTGGDSV